jgi:hypothetical protein
MRRADRAGLIYAIRLFAEIVARDLVGAGAAAAARTAELAGAALAFKVR